MPNRKTATSKPTAVIIQQGRVLDFIDGETQRKETPEEYVRQEIAKSLVREYGYSKSDISVEFRLSLGSRKPRADLVIFPADSDHKQESAYIIIECKKQEVRPADKKDGIGQLESYLSACPNASYGMWTNGVERFCYHVLTVGGKRKCEERRSKISSVNSSNQAESA